MTGFGPLIWLSIAACLQEASALECLNCTAVAEPNLCNDTTVCASDESCYVQATQTSPVTRYQMGCQNNELCTSSNLHGGADVVGRALNLRQMTGCHECCLTDECNGRLCDHEKPTACIDSVTVDCALLNSLLNLCSDVDHAKTICPKYCGLCNLVDGNWADWSSWGQCDVTCENGTQLRTRTCTNPEPKNGGTDCVGSENEKKVCVRELCPVDGGWSVWNRWSACSVSCDAGLATRQRNCNNPKPDRCGDHCFGDPFEARICMQRPCADGGWSQWSPWGVCEGRQLARNRSCNNPEPSMFGKQCAGSDMQTKPCSGGLVYFNAHGHSLFQTNYLTYPSVVDNLGHGYQSNNGSFVAPVEGQFFFSAQICTSNGQTVNVQLRHVPLSGSELAIAGNRAHGSGDYDCATASAPVLLRTGDQVRVFTSAADRIPLFDDPTSFWTSFSGVLIQ
ncbi:thrombospondin-2-like [Mya arenaria]|uniref:thrombospondin-2-like n=1 Tax=Mya arenaria TaxID=6604 RepID=UPI0022E5A4FC|nr:thrombospondin-2-like [Mya arenaria]